MAFTTFVPGTVITSEFLNDVQDAEYHSYLPAGTGAVDTTVETKLRQFVSVLDFGAVADASTTTGTDNTAAFQAAIDHCESTGQSLYIPEGRYYFNGGKLTIDQNLVVYGDGIDNTVLVFGGTPTKSVVTRIVWRVEYDSGNYASNSDAAVAWALRVNAQNVTLRDFTVTTNHNPSIDYPLPFNSATDFPTSVYEYGILVQSALNSQQTIKVSGVWNTAALCIDGSNVGGIGDGFEAFGCQYSGFWGVRVIGAQGQPISGNNYQDLNPLDTRTSAGVSDIVFDNCKIYDTSGSVRLTINGTSNLLVRRSDTGGALYINGQCNNSAERIQGIHFNNCRIAPSDRYVYFVNYGNRVRFTNCHSEFRSGARDTDGVSTITGSDCEIVVTENARRVLFLGGEKSGETDSRVFKNTTLNIPIINEIAYDDPDPPGSVPAASMLQVGGLRDRGIWTPSLTASTPGTPTYTTASGSYARIGNMVFIQARVTLSSKGGITGNISIAGLPYTASNIYGGVSQDTPIAVLTSSVTTGDAGTSLVINDATTTASLIKLRSAATIQNITDADLVDTSRIDFSGWYMTEDA